jgi:hypothetical protein
MSGKIPRMNSLASRKKLLVAESDLNRAQLVQEWQAMADDVHALTKRAKSLSFIVSTTASLVAGLAAFRRHKTAPTAEKPSWLQTFLKGAGLVSTIWQTFRFQGRDQKNK